VLRSLFGPSREEIWRQVAARVGGVVHEGGFLSGSSKLVARHGEWELTLDTYTTSSGTGNDRQAHTHTRMRAPYVNADGFRFHIRRATVFSGLSAAFGFQDVEVGFEEFDREFVIKGTEPLALRRLFANPTVRDLLRRQPDVTLSVAEDEGWFGSSFPRGVDELRLTTADEVRDPELLRGMFDLFAAVLDQLCRIDSAYEDDPGVEL